MSEVTEQTLLTLLGGSSNPRPDELRQLIIRLDSHKVIAKVFLLEGVPHVFEKSPMKYVIFREQVADRFGVGSQDVCIVGSARLGYSPSPGKFGTPFSKTSDVDVVVISEPLFYEGSRELFKCLSYLKPALHEIRPFCSAKPSAAKPPVVNLNDWRDTKEGIRNFVFENFNPGLLPDSHFLRREIFDKISSTSGLFLALEPKIFVSKIRTRIFRTWKAAEDYYANTLREAKNAFVAGASAPEIADEEDSERIEQPIQKPDE